jgi:hypothetical protein
MEGGREGWRGEGGRFLREGTRMVIYASDTTGTERQQRDKGRAAGSSRRCVKCGKKCHEKAA